MGVGGNTGKWFLAWPACPVLVAYMEPNYFCFCAGKFSSAAPTTVGAFVVGTVPKGGEGGQDFIQLGLLALFWLPTWNQNIFFLLCRKILQQPLPQWVQV